MEAALNKQIELECYASFLYLSMASWCDKEGLESGAKFMNQQSEEERDHMLRIFHYISEVDGHALVPAVKKPPALFKSNFLQWYVEEQREEEALMRMVMDRIKLIGDGPQSLYYIEKEIEQIHKAESAAKAAADAEDTAA